MILFLVAVKSLIPVRGVLQTEKKRKEKHEEPMILPARITDSMQTAALYEMWYILT